jgi:hypothetical protein
VNFFPFFFFFFSHYFDQILKSLTFGGLVGCTARKKRRTISHRPHHDSQAFQQRFNLLPSFAQPFSSGRHNENKNFGDPIIASDNLGTENKLKRLKLRARLVHCNRPCNVIAIT